MTAKDPAPDIWSLTQPGARRSLVFCAVGAVVGLLIAGIGLFTAQGTRTSTVPAEDVALVNNVPILTSDYITQIRALYDVPLSRATPEQKRRALEDMIREELYVQRGIELGMQADTVEVRTALTGAVEAAAAADATMAQPDEAQLQAYYKRSLARYADEGTMQLADYLVPAGVDAVAAVAALRAAGSGAIARYRLRQTDRMRDGEEYRFAARIHLGDALFAVADRLRDGQVSDPVTRPDGVHILVMARHVTPPPRPFQEVRDRVLNDYVAVQSKVLTAGNDRFLRKRADILIQKGFE